MTLIVDASVALKWVLAEEGSEDAAKLLLGEPLAAPDLLMVECANVLWTKARRRVLTREQASVRLAGIKSVPMVQLPSDDYVIAAQAIAFDIDHSVYDSLYLALALAERAILVTADLGFAAAASRHGVYAASIRLLGA